MQPKLRLLLMTVSVILSSFVNNSVFGQATVNTDSADYHPGDTVAIAGTGWQGGETVSLHIVSDCGCTDVTYYAVADASGNIYNKQFLITEAHLGASFILSADGQNSLLHAEAAFTDALKTWTGAAGDSKWNTAGNWSGGVPGSLDEAVFNSTTTQSIIVDVNVSIARLTIQNTGLIILQPDNTSRTITLSNASTALNIQSGSTLRLRGTADPGGKNITLLFSGAGNTATIAGSLELNTPSGGPGGSANYNATNSSTTVSGSLYKFLSTNTITSTNSNLTFSSTGTFGLYGGATVPTATWQSGSTLYIRSGSTSGFSGLSQSFSNVILDGDNTVPTWQLSGGLTTVNGDLTINSTTLSNEYRLVTSNGSPYTLNIGGNLNVEEGVLSLIGGATAGTNTSTINVAGNVNVSGSAVLNMNTGSNAGSSTLNIGGGFAVTNTATLKKSFAATGTVKFNKSTGTQSFSSTANGINTNNIGFVIGTGTSTNTLQLNSNFPLNSSASLQVSNNAIIDFAINTVTGGSFTAFAGSKMITANNNGLGATGSIQTTSIGINSLSDVEFQGSNTGVFPFTTTPSASFRNVTINRSGGVTLDQFLWISNDLNFASGKLNTGTNTVTLFGNATVSNAGPGKYINGKLERHILTGSNVSKTFDIGDANNYAPVTVIFDNVTTGGTLTANVTGTDHADIANSGISSVKSVNHAWTLTNNGIVFNTSTNTASVTLNWVGVGTDADAGSDPTKYVVAKYDNPTWTLPAFTNRTSTSIQVTAISSFSDFIVGEIANTAPSVTDVTKSVNEDNTLLFTSTDFTNHFTDPESNSLAKIKILSLPSNGILKLNTTNVNVDDEILFADLGNLNFVPTTNYNGSASFSWNGSDGSLYAASPANVNITINSVNDAPSGADKTIATNEDVDYIFTAADFGFTDANDNPANNFASVKLTTLPSAGSLTLSGSNITIAGTLVTIADINAGNLKFHPATNANGNGYGSFTFQVQDDGSTSNGGADLDGSANTITVNVTAVNDAPTVNDVTKSGSEDNNISFSSADFTAHFNDVDADGLVKIKVTSLPSVSAGVLKLSGTPVAADDEITAANISNLVFVPADNYNGPASFGWNGSDGSLYAVMGANVNITINAANDAPTVVNAIADVTVDEDAANTIIDLSNTFDDVDEDLLTITVQENTNTYLVTATYNNETKQLTLDYAANAHGTATITIRAADGTTYVEDQFIVTVRSVNDAPSGANKTVTTNEDADYTFLAADFGFTDVNDNPANSLAAVKLTTLPATGTVTLSGSAVTVAGTFISIADINAGNLKFHPVANGNGSSYSLFTFQVQDNGGINYDGVDLDPSAKTMTINVTAVNDAPTVTDVSKSGTEDVTVSFALTDFSAHFSDIDGDLLNKIQITSLPLHGTLKLNSVDVALNQEIAAANIVNLTLVPEHNYNGVVSFAWNGSDGTAYAVTGASVNITLAAQNDAPTVANAISDVAVDEDAANTIINLTNTFADVDGDALTITVNNNTNTTLVTASYNAATKELTMHYNSNKNGTATITIRASDGSLYVDDQFDVTVRSVNDAPAGTDKTVNINEDHSYTFSAANFGFSDPNDNPANTFSGMKITTVPVNGSLKLSGTDVSAGDVIPVASIGNLVFTPANNNNGSPYASFTFQVQDNGGTSYNGVDFDQTANTITINVTAINDVPSFTKGTDQTVLEDAGAQTVNNWATGIDDGDPEVSQTLSFVITNNTNPTLFTVAPSVDASGKLTYTPAANGNGSATITIKITDDGGTTNGGVNESATQTFAINVTAVNDAPSFTKGADQTVSEDAAAQTANGWATNLSKGGGTDEASQILSFVITNNTNTALFSSQPAVDASGNLTYTPAANVHGNATITIKITDNGGTANGGANESATQTFTITIRSVNDAPAGADKSITITEDNVYTFGTTDFGFTDPNDNPANNFFAVKITTLPSAGTLKNNGVSVALGSFILVTDITAGNLKFYPSANGNGSPYTSFTFQVQDDGGTSYSGVDVDPVANIITFNITAVNDVPVFTKGADQTVLEDAGAQTVVGWATAINDGDAEVSQTLIFNVSNNNNSLFSVQPSINPSTGTLTFTPAANANGIATVTVTLKDNGGTSDGGVDESAEQIFIITVTAVNDVPVFTKGADQTKLEDAGAITINGWATVISAGPADESSQVLTFHVSNDNNALFSVQPSVDASGNLTYTLAANKNGTATVTVYLTDNGGTANGGDDQSDNQTFTITVTSVNDAPAGTDKTININEDASHIFAATDFGFSDPNDNPANALMAVKITTLPSAGTLSNNGSPVSADAFISLIDINAGHLIFAPATNANGSPYTTFTFQVQDNGGTANYGADLDPLANTISFNVTAVNDAPVFTKGADQKVLEDAGAQTVNNWATGIDDGDADASQNVSFVITNNTNTALFSVLPSVSPTGTLTFTPALNANGTATISIKITDDGGTIYGGTNESAVQTFVINVTAVNDAPSFTKGANQTVNEDAGAQTVLGWATAINDGDPEVSQTLTFVVTNNTNTALFSAQPTVSSTGTLTYTPAANANGTATITIKITDDGGIANGGVNESSEQTFTITARSVNDAPSGTDKTVTTLEDNAYAFNNADFGFDDVNDNPKNTFSVVKITTLPVNGTLKNGLTNVVAGDLISLSDVNAGNLKFYPATNANGNSYTSFTFQVKDDGGIAYSGIDLDPVPNTITIKVTPVNDAPSFTKGVDKTVSEDALPQSFATWATNILKGGGADENIQSLTFIVTGNTNPGLFSVAPSVSSTGTLTFTPALNQNGSATITIKLTDDGGTDNGGANESAEQSFVITVTPVNDPPVTSITPSAAQTVQYSDGITLVTAWTLSGKMMVAPGTYVVRITVNDGAATDYKDVTINVIQENARAYYTGAFFASTLSTSSTTANVQLAATIKDITAVDGIDPNAGDIRNTKVSFKIVETGQIISNLVPVLIDPSDTKTGIITYPWTVDIGAADSKQFTIEIKVDNYYTRSSAEDDAVVTVSKPFNDFITGGGYIVLSNSIGTKAGDPGSKNNFGFNVKFNKSGTNLQGNINTIIRRKESDGIVHVYQVKGNSMTSLSTNMAQGPSKAVFNGKASIQDITNPLDVVSVDGGASLQVTITDMGEPGSSDMIGITVWSKTGALWFSSNWDGTRSVEQALAGGNLKVNSSSSPVTGTNPTQTTLSSNVSPSASGQSITFTAIITEMPAYASANPTGVITFLDGSTVIGTAIVNNTGTATFTTSSLKAGTHEMTAYYSGDSKFMISSGKTTQVVNAPIASSANPRFVDDAERIQVNVFNVKAYPNPAQSQFIIKLESSNTKEAVSILVYGVNGKIIESRKNLAAGQTIQLGALYRPGVYILEMIQGNQRKQLKLVKIPN